MAFGVGLLVWGEMASFTRPEMKVERVSYEVMTPSAARGILEAIYWKPEIRWVVDRIHVLNPIRFTHIRRNEIGTTIAVKGAAGVQVAMRRKKGDLGINVEDHRQQRAGTVLKDVRYGIEAHFEVLDNSDPAARGGDPPAKHLEMFRRRAGRGQYFHHPYLGAREFPAHFELVESFPEAHPELRGERGLGMMLLDIDYTPDKRGRVVDGHTGKRVGAQPKFFAAIMHDGIITVPNESMRGGRP